MAISTRYSWKDLIVTGGLTFPTPVEITNAGTDAFYLPGDHAFLEAGFELNTQADKLGIDITGFLLEDREEFLTTQYAQNVFQKVKITDPAYQTGTIYAFGKYSGDLFFSRQVNDLQDQITEGVSSYNIILAEDVTGVKCIAVDSSGEGILADITDTSKQIVLGMNVEDGTTANSIVVRRNGDFTVTAHGFTIGRQYYLGVLGVPILKENIPGNVSSFPLFIVKDANTLFFNVGQKDTSDKFSQQDEIGDYKYSAILKDHAGYLPFEFMDAPIKKSLYQDLWNEIGDIFEECQRDYNGLGAPASDEFYPVPTPGSYGRSAISLNIAVTSADSGSNYIVVPASDYNKLIFVRSQGLPIKLALVSGTLTGGLSENTIYSLGFLGSNQIAFYASEDNAINDTSRISLTDTNVGTWTLHQTGVKLDDSLQDHKIELLAGTSVSGATAPFPMGGNTINAGSTQIETSASQMNVVEKTNYGAPRLSNETRPKTYHQYGYIKVVDIDLSSGLPVSALEYSTGWNLVNTAWSALTVNINHALAANLSDLISSVFVSSDPLGANAIEAKSINYDTNTVVTTTDGVSLLHVDNNNVELQIGATGHIFVADNSGGAIRLDSETTWYYKVVLRKPTYRTQVYEPKYFYHDLTVSAIQFNLPDATTYIGKRTYEWENGTVGGNNATFSTVGSQEINGLPDNIWVGEGSGRAVFISDGTNWRLEVYTDSGSDPNGVYEKSLDLKLRQSGKITGCTIDDNTTTFPHPFINPNARVIPQTQGSSGVGTIINRMQLLDTVTATTARFRAIRTDSGTLAGTYTGDIPWIAEGEWA